MSFLKNFFSVQVLLFLAWVAITSLVFWVCIHFGYSRFWIFVPLAGGLAFLLWPRKPKTLNDKAGPGAALLVLALASGLLGCQSVPSTSRPATATEIATAEQLFPAPLMVTDSNQWTGPKLVTAR